MPHGMRVPRGEARAKVCHGEDDSERVVGKQEAMQKRASGKSRALVGKPEAEPTA